MFWVILVKSSLYSEEVGCSTIETVIEGEGDSSKAKSLSLAVARNKGFLGKDHD